MSYSLLFVWYNQKQTFYKTHALRNMKKTVYLRHKFILSTTINYGFVSITNRAEITCHSQDRFKLIKGAWRSIMVVSVILKF